MPERTEGLAVVRSSLCDAVDRLTDTFCRLTPAALNRQVQLIQATAAEYGLLPLAEVSRALHLTVATGAPQPLVRAYLAAMRDAAGCHGSDPLVAQAYLASVGVRLVG